MGHTQLSLAFEKSDIDSTGRENGDRSGAYCGKGERIFNLSTNGGKKQKQKHVFYNRQSLVFNLGGLLTLFLKEGIKLQ